MRRASVRSVHRPDEVQAQGHSPVMEAEDFLSVPPDGTSLPHVRSLDLGAGQRMGFCWSPAGVCRVGRRDRGYAGERPVRKRRLPSGF